ncbi:MAG: SBBP repeat-containing protein [bacterium]|nr:SBBP repeat-containing protein [bacterium]
MNKKLSLLMISAALICCSCLDSFAGLHLGLSSAVKSGVQDLKDEKEKKEETILENSTANHAPVILSLTANSVSISTGSTTTITCSASDPDNDSLTYTWNTASGIISGIGSQITWTAPGTSGSYLINCTVEDGRNGTALQSVNITVTANSSTNNPTKAWTKLLGTSNPDEGLAVSSDLSGNIYITGYSGGNLDGNTNQGLVDVFISKYDGTGTKLWTKLLGSSNNDAGYGIATDLTGNIYVTGYTFGNISYAEGSPDTTANKGASDIFLAKYDTNGIKLWVKQFGTTDYDDGWGIATDSSGNIYITGYSKGNLDGNINQGEYDVFLTKYDANGTKEWTKLSGTSKSEKAYGIAIDTSGNIYITGETQGSLDGNTNQGSNDIFIIKYDTNGTKLWTRQHGSAGYDAGVGAAIDSIGNIYISGYTRGSLDGNTNQGDSDIFLLKYNANGTKLWTKQIGTSASDQSFGVAIDTSDNVYVTGNTYGNLDGNTRIGGSDLFLAEYDIDGTKLFSTQIGSNVSEEIHSVKTDPTGDIYITGWTNGNLDGNTNQGAPDIFLIKLEE